LSNLEENHKHRKGGRTKHGQKKKMLGVARIARKKKRNAGSGRNMWDRRQTRRAGETSASEKKKFKEYRRLRGVKKPWREGGVQETKGRSDQRKKKKGKQLAKGKEKKKTKKKKNARIPRREGPQQKRRKL